MPTDINILATIDVIAIVVGVVSVIVSILAFFASILFFLKGQKLQERATEALITIQEKSANIETQVGGMFDKTLSAALTNTNKEEASERFESLQQKLKDSGEEIAKQVQKDIQGVGHEKVEELVDSVKKEFSTISAELKLARNNLDLSQIVIPKILRTSPSARRILRELSYRNEMSLSRIIKSGHASESLKLRRLQELCRLGVLTKKEMDELILYYPTEKGILIAKKLWSQ